MPAGDDVGNSNTLVGAGKDAGIETDINGDLEDCCGAAAKNGACVSSGAHTSRLWTDNESR